MFADFTTSVRFDVDDIFVDCSWVTPGGSNTVHIYSQTVEQHKYKQYIEQHK